MPANNLTFDLIECQETARQSLRPKELFELWSEVCSKYDRGVIGRYELNEMKAVIWPKLQLLSALRQSLESAPTPMKSAA